MKPRGEAEFLRCLETLYEDSDFRLTVFFPYTMNPQSQTAPSGDILLNCIYMTSAEAAGEAKGTLPSLQDEAEGIRRFLEETDGRRFGHNNIR